MTYLLWLMSRMRNALTNQNQCRAFGVMTFDDPTDKCRSLGIEADNVFVPLHTKGYTCGTMMRAPTDEKLERPPRIYLSDENTWDLLYDYFQLSLVEEELRYPVPRLLVPWIVSLVETSLP